MITNDFAKHVFRLDSVSTGAHLFTGRVFFFPEVNRSIYSHLAWLGWREGDHDVLLGIQTLFFWDPDSTLQIISYPKQHF